MLLKDVWIDAPHRHRRLTLFRLMDPEGRTLPYRLMSEALKAGTLRIEEVDEEGSVPELMAHNAGERDVLVLDGQQLVGAKQNRMTNRSLILPAMTDTKIPVTCVEQGRWRRRRRGFRSGPGHAPPTLRRRVRDAEASGRNARGAAQSEVWEGVADFSRRTGVHSDTGALDDLYGARQEEIEDAARGFPLRAGQVGTLAALGDRVVGMDLVGCVNLYARLHRGLVRGFLFEALAEEGPTPENRIADEERAGPDWDQARLFLDRVAGAQRAGTPPVGRGTYRVLSGPVVGGELTDAGGDVRGGERLVHLSAFPEGW